MRILSNLNISGFLDIDTINNAAADTDKFLVADANGVVKFRTGAEVASDIGASVGYVSTVKHEVKLGEAIAKGQAVYVTSSDGTNMIVSKASNVADVTSSKTLGLLETGGATNAKAFVITEGLLAGLDTSTATAGAPVWLGTDGNLLYGLGTKPVAPAHMVFIGIVTRVNANNGEIFVKVQNGFELEELHNVLITGTPVDKAVIQYDTATGLWKNSTIGGVTGSGVTGQVAYWNGTNTQTGSNNLFWDATNGRLGIGTNVPVHSLDVVTNSLNTIARFFAYDGTYNPRFFIEGTIDGIRLFATYSSAAGNLMFGTGGAERMRISTSGNLLVGSTADTTERLQITGTSKFTDSATFTKAYVNTSDLGVIVSATIPGINLRTPTSGRISLISNYNSANSASIVTGTGTNNPTALQMLFDFTNLRVGIGTPTPNTKLDVLGAASVAGGTEGLRIGNLGDNSSYDNVKIYYTGFNAGAPRVYLTPRTTPGSGIVESFFHIQNSNGASTTSNNTMGLLVDGSVGIGTTAPAYKLEVHGVIRSSTDIISSGSFRTSTYDYLSGRTASRIEVYSSALNATDRVMDFGDETRGWTITSMQNGANVAELGINYRGADTLTQSVRFNLHAPLIGGSIFQVPFTGVSFAPTSGTAVFNTILSSPTINQTGGANGVTRGILIQPTLTAAADWRSIEWTNATGWGLYGSGTANNYLAGFTGIGTTTMTYAFNVVNTGATYVAGFRGGSNSYIVVGDTSLAGESGINFRNSSGQGFVGIGGTILGMSATSGANTITFSTGGNERVRVTSAGDVGIGTSAPSYKLDVVGTGVFGIRYNRTDGAAADARIVLQSGTASTNIHQYGESHASLASIFRLSSSGGIEFMTSGVAAARITTAQNFLIGSSSDDTVNKLQVTGGVRVAGSTTFNGNMTNAFASLAGGTTVVGGITGVSNGFRIDVNTSNEYQYAFRSGANALLFTIANTGIVTLNTYGTGTRTGTVAYNLAVDASGNIIETAGGVVDGSGTANYISKWQDANTLTNSLLFDNGTNVGIGTTSPTSILHVYGSSPSPLTVERSTVNSNIGIRYKNATTSWYSGLGSDDSFAFSFNDPNLATGVFKIATNGSTTISSTSSFIVLDNTTPTNGRQWRLSSAVDGKFYITQVGVLDAITILPTTGNVGIGIASPATKLELLDTVTTQLRVRMSGQADMRIIADTGYGAISNDSNMPLVLRTNATERMRISATGDVGIGTTTPSYKLHVVGSFGAATSGVTLEYNSGILYHGGSYYQFPSGGYYNIYGRSGMGLIFGSNNTEVGRFDLSGNFGIGTTAPNQKLQVAGFVNAQGYVNNTVTFRKSFYLGNIAAGATTPLGLLTFGSVFTKHFRVTITSYYGTKTVEFHGYQGNLGKSTYGFAGGGGEVVVEAVYTSTNITSVKIGVTSAVQDYVYTATVECMSLFGSWVDYAAGEVITPSTIGSATTLLGLANGFVGVNTNNPLYNLHVVSSAGTIAAFRNSGAALGQILIGNTAGDLQVRILATGDGLIFSDVSKYLAFGSNGLERIRITSAGDVGIGTTTPAYKLDVTGTARVTGDITGDSNLILGTLGGADTTIRINGHNTAYSTIDSNAGYNASYNGLMIRSNANNGNAGTDWQLDLGGRDITLGQDHFLISRFPSGGSNTALLRLNNVGALRLYTYGTGARTGTVAYNLAVDASGNVIETAGGVVDGSGTANYISKWQDSNTLTNSLLFDNGTTLLIGSTTSISNPVIGAGQLQIHSATYGSFNIYGTANSSDGSYIGLWKSRGANVVNNGDELGGIYFGGYDGSAYRAAANIMAVVDAATGANDMPSSLLFKTTTDGSNSPTTKMTLTNGGNLGLGVVPSAWAAGYKALQVLNLSLFGTSSLDLNLGSNVYYDGVSYKYIANGFASLYNQYLGKHYWNTAASGTAGNAITFTQAMTLDASGRLGIGQTAPTERLVVRAIGNAYVNSAALSIENSNGANKTYITNANGVFYISNSTTTDQFVLYSTGNLSLSGTSDTGERLQVNGTMKVTGASTFSSIVATSSINANNGVYASGTSVGYISMLQGTASGSGYINFYSAGSVRQGYIGFSATTAATDSGTIPYVAGSHAFTGAATFSSSVTVSSGSAPTGIFLNSGVSQLTRFQRGTSVTILSDNYNAFSPASQDNTTIPSWQIRFGGGSGADFYRIERSPASSTTMTNLFNIDGAGAATFSSSVNTGGNITITKTTDSLLDIRATNIGGTVQMLLNPTSDNNYGLSTGGGVDGLQFLRNGVEKMRMTNTGFGIGTTSINASARLQVDSTTQGFLAPRMTAAQRTAISTPAVGLVVYQTDGTEGLYIYTNANGWKSLAIVN